MRRLTLRGSRHIPWRLHSPKLLPGKQGTRRPTQELTGHVDAIPLKHQKPPAHL